VLLLPAFGALLSLILALRAWLRPPTRRARRAPQVSL
jgi:hypothetical protein